MEEPTTSNNNQFVCERCHHKSSCKGNLIKHLSKKNPCETTHSKKSREDIVTSLTRVSDKPKTFVCDYCDKAFSSVQGKSQHKKICPKHPKNQEKEAIEALTKRLEQVELELQRHRMEAGGVNNNNTMTNNIQNQIINIQNININSFGNETMPQFEADFLNNCIMNPSKGLPNLIEKIHYNESIPENHNLRYKSTKNKTLEKYIDHTWHECDASNTLDELIKKGYAILARYYTQNQPLWHEDEAKVSMYEKFRFLGDKKSKDYSAVKRDLLLLVKDKTMFILAPNGTNLNQEEINEIVTEVQDEFNEDDVIL
jgi:hypothetical protein